MEKSSDEKLNLSRRQFLAGIGVSLAGLVYVSPLDQLNQWTRWIDGSAADSLKANLKGLFAVGESAQVIGKLYLKENPHEKNSKTLLHHLNQSGLLDQISAANNNRDAIKEIIRSKIRRDFHLGETLQLDGWVLSRTEARLCALSVAL